MRSAVQKDGGTRFFGRRNVQSRLRFAPAAARPTVRVRPLVARRTALAEDMPAETVCARPRFGGVPPSGSCVSFSPVCRLRRFPQSDEPAGRSPRRGRAFAREKGIGGMGRARPCASCRRRSARRGIGSAAVPFVRRGRSDRLLWRFVAPAQKIGSEVGTKRAVPVSGGAVYGIVSFVAEHRLRTRRTVPG